MSTPAATVAGRRRASARSSRSKPTRSKRARRSSPKPAKRTSRARASRRLSLGSWKARLAVVVLLIGALAIGYFAWFRHSGFVAVREVKIEGVHTADRDKVTAALTDAASGMTTLDVDAGRLADAVSGFPTVAAVNADANFPHGLTVHVTERDPELVATDGSRKVAVTGGGSLLPGVEADDLEVPALPVDDLPASGRLRGEALEESHLIGAAPSPLQRLIKGAKTGDDGIVVTLGDGIDLRFGTASNARAKWAAAAAVLADPEVTTLEYVDLRVPSRPAIGG